MMHRGEGEDVKRIDPFDYYPIIRFFVPFRNKQIFNKFCELVQFIPEVHSKSFNYII